MKVKTSIAGVLASYSIFAFMTEASDINFSSLDTIPVDSRNIHYISNELPLQPQKLIKLPIGSIQPEGWLKKQLELQADGLNGHLSEISAWLQRENNAWLKTDGEWGWEEVPYWLRGFSSAAYILKDEDMLKEAKFWIDAILASQREDGNFGPKYEGRQDFWPNMIALWILQSWQEYTGDERVIPFMKSYCSYLQKVPDEDFLASYWENSRGGDNLWSVVWLYNRTKDPELLKLAEKIHKNTADWTQDTQLPNWHNVNIAQCFREPATWYLFNGNEEMLSASYNVHSLIRRAFGQVPGGMFGADENARIGFFDPRQGTETCGFAEQMASDEIMMLITGDSVWAENCEDIAFNSYPAAFMPDYRSLRYITSPNHVVSDSKNHHPGIDNKGPFLAMNPFSSRCCQHNHGFAWPYYIEHLVMATPDNGVAALLYSACTTEIYVGNEKKNKILLEEETLYPFDDRIVFRMSMDQECQFPLYLRIPSWTTNPELTIISASTGEKIIPPSSIMKSGDYLRIERLWQNDDQVYLKLPMNITYRVWAVNKNSVSVNYGPLTLSLEIKERYEKKDSKETAIHDSKWQENADASAWPSYEIYPDSPWNYALVTNAPIALKEVKHQTGEYNPFTQDTVPLKFAAKGKKIPSWKIDKYGLCGVLPSEDALREDELEDITLIPMGAARLRITAFPQASR